MREVKKIFQEKPYTQMFIKKFMLIYFYLLQLSIRLISIFLLDKKSTLIINLRIWLKSIDIFVFFWKSKWSNREREKDKKCVKKEPKQHLSNPQKLKVVWNGLFIRLVDRIEKNELKVRSSYKKRVFVCIISFRFWSIKSGNSSYFSFHLISQLRGFNRPRGERHEWT